MAPDLIFSRDADELRDLAKQISEYQEAKNLNDSAMVRRFTGLGSTKTYSRIRIGDLAELDLDRWLSSYRAVWALIESVGDQGEKDETLYDDLTPYLMLRKVFLETNRNVGNNRFILIEGDTGLGKTKSCRLLCEKYGQRFLFTEATDVWQDNPGALLSEILKRLGDHEPPHSRHEKLDRVVGRLCQSRIGLIIDEGHHLGPHCLNTLKTILNQSPGEIIVAAMPTLWRRLERSAYEECRQLTGNRLAERIKLRMRESDVAKMIKRRLPEADEAATRRALPLILDRAQRHGNLGFVRDVIDRVAELAEGTAGPDIEAWSAAVSAEVESR